MIEYVRSFGEQLGLDTHVDEVGNVIIRKPATPGLEDRPGIILQGHLDMVPQKNADVNHCFDTDPIHAYIEGSWVKARGTTLGADNGIGVAAAMAVLAADDLKHGPIEALFTIDEETGMTGAFGLKPGLLKGSVLINLDSEDEGELFVGCAGGVDVNARYHYQTEAPSQGPWAAFALQVGGLKGGHSGCDIHLGRGNANKILVRILKQATDDYGMRLAEIDGGSLRNAIPRDARANVLIPQHQVAAFNDEVTSFEQVIKAELALIDPDLWIKATPIATPDKVLLQSDQNAIIHAVYACQNGVYRMSDEVEGVVETSNNLARVVTNDGLLSIQCLVRSSVDSAKKDLAMSIGSAFALIGADVAFEGAYPGWKPNAGSTILKQVQGHYEDLFDTTPDVKVIHAGLECGLLGGVYPHWDMISFGPTIRFPHSPDEQIDIASVGKFWQLLVRTIERLAQ